MTPNPSDETGSGSLLGLTIIGGVALVLGMSLPLYMGLAVRASVEGAADASALAGADVAAGFAPGEPCAVAAMVASANRVTLGRCTVDGLVVTVTTSTAFAGLALRASAAAGPPGVRTN